MVERRTEVRFEMRGVVERGGTREGGRIVEAGLGNTSATHLSVAFSFLWRNASLCLLM